jgi:hypothetical protein
VTHDEEDNEEDFPDDENREKLLDIFMDEENFGSDGDDDIDE